MCNQQEQRGTGQKVETIPQAQGGGSEELMFMYDQLRKEILHNDTLTLQTLIALVALNSAMFVLAASTAVSDSHVKAIIFFVAEGIALLGLFQVVDRGRSTYIVAAYLRTFIEAEPDIQHLKWETRLHRFRKHDRILGYGSFHKHHVNVYRFLAIANCGIGSCLLILNKVSTDWSWHIAGAVIVVAVIVTRRILNEAREKYEKVVVEHDSSIGKAWRDIRKQEERMRQSRTQGVSRQGT